ncbi:MAG: AAA family ATPase [Chloroflexota bacterium]
MKVAVIGKGGTGKTVISGVLARSLARQGHRVIALDCDSNPNLGISLGVGVDITEHLAGVRQALEEGQADHAPSIDEMLERFGTQGPDGIRLAVVTKIDTPDPG